MSNMKKLLALLLCAALCLMLLAACGSGSTASESDGTEAAETEQPAEEEAAAQEEETPAETEEAEEEPASEETEAAEEDVPTLRFMICNLDGTVYDSEQIDNAINEITVPAIGVAVQLELLDPGSFPTQLTMEIAAGEEIDIASMTLMPSVTFSNMVTNGQVLALNDYLDQDYCSDIIDVVGDYLPACTIGGNVYGLPTYRLYGTNQYMQLRTDILNDLGIMDDYLNAETWADLKTVFETVRDNTDLYPIGPTTESMALYCGSVLPAGISEGGPLSDAIAFDSMGDSLALLYGQDDGTVSVNYLQPEFVELMETTVEWQNEGLIYPDCANTSEPFEIINGNVGAGCLISAETAVDAGFYSYPVTRKLICTGMIKTSAVQAWGLYLPITCAEPEAAMKFIDLLYVNSDLMNLLVYGIEGETYVLNDEGEACYPDGVDLSTVSYRGNDWMEGNQFICYPADGYGGNFRQEALEINASAPVSQYLGFVFDTTEMSDTIAALTSVYDEYFVAMTGGQYTEDLYNEFVSAAESAGMNDYIAECQRQVDAWMAG